MYVLRILPTLRKTRVSYFLITKPFKLAKAQTILYPIEWTCKKAHPTGYFSYSSIIKERDLGVENDY